MRVAALRLLATAGLLALVAACSTTTAMNPSAEEPPPPVSTTPNETNQPAPGFEKMQAGTEEDFILNVGRRIYFTADSATLDSVAKATLAPSPQLRWDDWTGDYRLVRDLIEATYPKDFKDFNARMFEPGGFYRGNAAHERVWKTESGKAVITTPPELTSLGFGDAPGRFRLITLRSNDQFNTTIYGYSDRFRGIEGTREVVLMNPEDIAEAGFTDGQMVRLAGDTEANAGRALGGLKLTAYQLPRGTIAGYYPECNVLIATSQHDELSKTPASKSIPVRVLAD